MRCIIWRCNCKYHHIISWCCDCLQPLTTSRRRGVNCVHSLINYEPWCGAARRHTTAPVDHSRLWGHSLWSTISEVGARWAVRERERIADPRGREAHVDLHVHRLSAGLCTERRQTTLRWELGSNFITIAECLTPTNYITCTRFVTV